MIPEMTIVAMTLFAECRGEPLEGKMAVASVIVNRHVWNKVSMRDVCLRPYQFSCWNGYKGKHDMMQMYRGGQMTGPAWEECKLVARMILDDTLPETKFTHYYNPRKAKPVWAAKLKNVKTIGRHRFGTLKNENR